LYKIAINNHTYKMYVICFRCVAQSGIPNRTCCFSREQKPTILATATCRLTFPEKADQILHAVSPPKQKPTIV